ncbi:hypothetical protein BDZ97DRAFT_1815954 [Flammula alnicola]|nr:hypothetical protein BDZ97DRAFT_1815954 [Flammula alnicola]
MVLWLFVLLMVIAGLTALCSMFCAWNMIKDYCRCRRKSIPGAHASLEGQDNTPSMSLNIIPLQPIPHLQARINFRQNTTPIATPHFNLVQECGTGTYATFGTEDEYPQAQGSTSSSGQRRVVLLAVPQDKLAVQNGNADVKSPTGPVST